MASDTQYKQWDDTSLPALKKIYLTSDGIWVVKLDVGGVDTLYEIDLTDVSNGYYQSEDEFAAGIYSASVKDGVYAIQVASHNADGYSDIVDSNENGPYPYYVFVADNETESLETGTAVSPDWIQNRGDLSYLEKQALAVDAIENVWRPEKRRWLTEAIAYSDLHTDLVSTLGVFLNRAEQCIQSVFQDPDVDPLLVVDFVREISQSAVGIDTIEDLAQFVNSYIQLGVTPSTTVARTWVKFEGVGDDRTVERITPQEVLRDEGYQTPLIANFDSIAVGWIKANQDGSAVLSDNSPAVGDILSVTVTDPDGNVGNIEYQWQIRRGESGNWSDVAGGTAQTFEVLSANVGFQIRVRVRYTDNANTDTADKNEVFSEHSELATAV